MSSGRFDDVRDPQARAALQQADEAAAELEEFVGQAPEMAQRMREALGGDHAPEQLVNTMQETMQYLGGATQDFVHEIRMSTRTAADAQRAAEQDQEESP
ncbi:hypothetical protein [Bounagaea algeriensis]